MTRTAMRKTPGRPGFPASTLDSRRGRSGTRWNASLPGSSSAFGFRLSDFGLSAFLLLLIVSAVSPTSAAAADIRINEFLASNVSQLQDEDRDYSDWIEIYNADTNAVNLGGWFLTDDAAGLTQWRFPDFTLLPDSYLLIFASEKNKTNILGTLHTNFKLARSGEFLALLDPATNIISQFAPAYPSQKENVSYGRDQSDPSLVGFFFSPTPGLANSGRGTGFAPEVGFSRNDGHFTHPFSLRLAVFPADTNATIRYTLNGTVPGVDSPIYVSPISITNSVQVRARTFQQGLLPGPVQSGSYVRMSTNLWDFTSDLPIVVLHSFNTPFPGKETFFPAYFEIIEPTGGRAVITNLPTVATRIGIQDHGSSTSMQRKPNIRVELWDELNDDKEMELLGLSPNADFLFYAPNNFDPIEIYNPLIYDLSRRIGRYAPHTRYVELYLVIGSGPVTRAHYHGLYVLLENVKLAPGRVEQPTLDPQDVEAPEVTGGYLLKVDRAAPGDTSLIAGGQGFQAVNPKGPEIRRAQRSPQLNYITNYINAFGDALNGPDFRDPELGYAAYIDVDSWIDHSLLNVLAFNIDSLRHSAYFYKEREGKLVFGPIWDFDRAFTSTDGRSNNPFIWSQTASLTEFFTLGSQQWWGRLFQDIDFWQKWIDRWQELRPNLISTTNLHAMVDQHTDKIREAIARDYSRWAGWINPRGGFQGEITLLKNWLANRGGFIDGQFQAPPRISSSGGDILPGFGVELSVDTAGTIYYTLDGTDPRAPGGDVADHALIYSEPIVLTQNARVTARVHNPAHQNLTGGVNPPLSSSWSGVIAETFVVTTPALVITEIMYHPRSPSGESSNRDEDFEFIELRNVGSDSLDLAGFRVSGGVRFEFTGQAGQAGQNMATLASGERVVIVKDLAAFRLRYPAITNVAGVYDGTLNNAGDRLRLEGPLREPILDFRYDDGWYPLTDGFGFSLVIVDDQASLDSWSEQVSWTMGGDFDGSPGTRGTPQPVLAPVVISEVLTHQTAPQVDVVELQNPAPEPVDVGGWFLTDDLSVPRKYRIPPATIIAPGGYAVFSEAQFNSGPDDARNFAFSSKGEALYLFSGNAQAELSGAFHGFDFGASDLNVTFGRYLDSIGREHFVAQSISTLGGANSSPRVGPVVISEIMYQPPPGFVGPIPVDDVAGEFIELHNINDGPVPLFDPSFPTNTWGLTEAINFKFPMDVVLAPRGYAVVVSFDPADASALDAFRQRYDLPENVRVFGPYRGKLSNTSESVELYKPRHPEPPTSKDAGFVARVLVDRVAYSDNVPWPVAADGIGPSLQRVDPALFGDDPANWAGATPSAGRAFEGGESPGIAVQPRDVTLVAFHDTSFSVIPSGPGPFRYQWRFNGLNLPNATNSVLSITNVQPSQGGAYVVVVLNPAGTQASEEVMLEVLLPASILEQPQPLDLRLGSEATFSISATSSTPMRFQWRRGYCRDGEDIPGATNSSYTIPSVSVPDQGVYTAVVTDGIGPVCSVPVLLNVLVPARVTQHPVAVTAVQGDDVSFFVTATGNPLPMTYRWRLNGRTQTNYDAAAYSSTYVRHNVQPADAGRYSVVVANMASVGVLSRSAVLTVLQDTDGDHLPDIYESSTPGIDPSDPDDGELDFDGDGFTNLEEYIAGTDLNHASSFLSVQPLQTAAGAATIQFLAASNRSYSVQFRESQAVGRWVRLADIPAAPSNRVETVLDPYPMTEQRLYRLVAPQQSPPEPGPAILVSPQSQEVAVGSDVELSVVAVGNEPLSYQWSFQGNEIRSATNHTLWLPNVQTNQIGSYAVSVSQLFGLTRSEPAFLNVLILPEIIEQPQGSVVQAGQGVTLRVIATGVEPLIYRWYHNNQPLRGAAGAGPVLTLENVTEADAGVYSVAVKHVSPFGPAGIRSQGAKVKVIP